uniref:Titin n=1 Tax=Monopterus albus TaxID=43700 RepID=A0A3Q3JDF2_MONAL
MINIRAASTLRLFVPVRGRPSPEVKWGKAEGEIKETAQIDNTGSYASLVIENVDRYDSGKYTLTAENASGQKSAFISVRVLDSPSPPTNLMVKEITKNSLTLTWEPPLLDGGSKIKHYIVEKRESTRKVYSPVTTCNKMSCKVEPLPEGGIFFFRVLAENEYGVGLPAKTIEPIKISEKPQPPGKVSVVDVTRSTVTLTWEKPEHDGGSRISHYEVELAPEDSDAWSVCASVKALETVVTNLLKGEEYQFRVVAVNDKGRSDPRQLAQSVVVKDLVIQPAVRPQMSTYTVQVGHDLKIEVPVAGHPKPTITWTKDGTVLKQTTRVNVADTAHHTTLTIKDATREDGGMYSINVSNTLGSKDATIEVITLDKPGPPTGPVKLEDISYDGGSPITGYVIERRKRPDTRWMKASFTNIIDTQFTLTGLTEDCVYEFRVIAKNAAGISSRPSQSTGEITAKDEIEAPEATMNSKFKDLIVVHAGETFIIDADYTGKPLPEVIWLKDGKEIDKATPRMEINTTLTHTILTVKDCIRVDGGHFVLKLVNVGGVKIIPVNKRETSRLSWTVVEPKIQAISYKITKLLPGNEYIFRVTAVNKYGVGEPLESEPVIARNPFTTPSAPSTPEASAITKDSMVLTWERPEDNGGAEIEGYILEKRDKDGIRWTKCNKKRLSDLRFRCTGLTEGHSYEFRVSAENAAGIGKPSTPTQYIKACDAIYPPGPPNNPKVTDHSSTTVSLSWSRPIYDGGAQISGYVVEMKEAADDEWIICTPPTALEATIDGLSTGEEYSFRVIAVNDKGKSDAKPLATPVMVKDILVEPIINLLFNTFSVKAGEDLKIDVPFKGRPHPEVSWKKDGQMLKQTTRVSVLTSKTSSKIVIKDATKEDVGKYEITLTNSVGTKTAEMSVIILDKPGPPSNIKVDEVSADFISLSWDPPTYDGGCQINNYVVEKRDTTTTTWQIVSATIARTSIKVSHLTQGTEYQFRVAAENRYGKSPAIDSVAIIAQYPFEPPGSPTNLHVAHATKTGMLVVWGRPASDGGSAVIGYHIECKEQSSILWTKVNRGLLTESHIAGDSGRYDITASNSRGTTKSFINIVVLDRPSAPLGPVELFDITEDSVSLKWLPPACEGGSPITNYIIQKRETTTANWLDVCSAVARCNIKIMKLTTGLEYQFRIRAENRYGISDHIDSPTVTVRLPYSKWSCFAFVFSLIIFLLCFS